MAIIHWVTREVANEADLRFNTIANKVSRITTVEANQLVVSRVKLCFGRGVG
jgi:hypothetical protein